MKVSGELEDSTFAFDLLLGEVFFAGAVGDVFAEDDDAGVAAHFVVEAGVDEVGHGAVGTVGGGGGLERWAGGVVILGILMAQDGCGFG